LLAVHHGGRGDLATTNVVWSMQKFLQVPSPLYTMKVSCTSSKTAVDESVLVQVEVDAGISHWLGQLVR
jgi:hypothetical protein